MSLRRTALFVLAFTFTGSETLQAFADLVAWVEFGAHPSP
jgi:hypothetical protein